MGVHPHHARGFRKFSNFQFSIFKKIEQLAAHPKVVAIGEVGLDYHKYEKTKYEIEKSEKEWKKLKIVQKQLLGMQIELAKKLNKPLIIHSREAKDEVLDTVNHFSKSDGKMPWGVFHCFEGRASYMKHVLEAGFYISFTGNIVYNKDRAQVAKKVPLDKLLLETDCPYFAKASKGKPCLRSTPCDVKILADFHAKVRGVSLSEVESQTTKNAKALFGI